MKFLANVAGELLATVIAALLFGAVFVSGWIVRDTFDGPTRAARARACHAQAAYYERLTRAIDTPVAGPEVFTPAEPTAEPKPAQHSQETLP